VCSGASETNIGPMGMAPVKWIRLLSPGLSSRPLLGSLSASSPPWEPQQDTLHQGCLKSCTIGPIMPFPLLAHAYQSASFLAPFWAIHAAFTCQRWSSFLRFSGICPIKIHTCCTQLQLPGTDVLLHTLMSSQTSVRSGQVLRGGTERMDP
jgi:hypothetical protein